MLVGWYRGEFWRGGGSSCTSMSWWVEHSHWDQRDSWGWTYRGIGWGVSDRLAARHSGQGDEVEASTITRGERGGLDPPPKVTNIDELISDIYEMRYHVSQLSAHMYHSSWER